MDKRDLLFLAAGVAFVVALSLLLHPPAVQPPAGDIPPPAAPTPPLSPPPAPPEATRPEVAPQRIVYTERPHQYTVYLLPADIASYGNSDPPWVYRNVTTFAVMEGSRGGVTERFAVPYPLWRINCSVAAERTPQYARFQVALMDAETGSLVDALEMRYPGSSTRIIREHSREFYLIVGASQIDRFTIALEVPDDWTGAPVSGCTGIRCG
ncbi:MAG: hypothetical protein QMD46_04200 [Methanomicrobiales archaeon]|nr:hypothetical protein [Methanomicrobiales archaeon]MDI6876512.1 hypothetical protein [Methanomicrobiales archaeon]